MRTTIISKSKNGGSSNQGFAKGWTLRYDNRFIGLVRKVEEPLMRTTIIIEVQKSRLLKPLSRRDSPTPSLTAHH